MVHFGFEIISQDELVAEYEKMGEQIPPAIVFTPYFEIEGKGYYVVGDRQGLIDAIDEALGLKSDNLVDAIRELGRQMVDHAKAIEGCPMTQVHMLPREQCQELIDACEGRVPFTFHHLRLYYQSYVGEYCLGGMEIGT